MNSYLKEEKAQKDKHSARQVRQKPDQKNNKYLKNKWDLFWQEKKE